MRDDRAQQDDIEERLKYPSIGGMHKWEFCRTKENRFGPVKRGEMMTDTKPAKKPVKATSEKKMKPEPKTIAKAELKAVSRPKETVEIVIRKKILGEAPVEKHFVVSDGKKLKNVKDLIDSLETMNDDTFRYHANEFKNDFATWLRDVFSHENLARDMEMVKHRLEAQRVLMKKLMDEIEKAAK